MIKYIVFLFICFGTMQASAQQSDFIVLKKRNKPVRRIYAGQNIEFVTTNNAYRDGLINRIANDSIYLQEFLVRRLYTTFGTYILDTAGSFRYTYHYNQIHSFGKPQKGFNVQGSGAALLGGGIILTLGSGVVYLADREKFSGSLMAASAALALAGYFMSKAGSKGIVIGKKHYHLQYINLTNNKSK